MDGKIIRGWLTAAYDEWPNLVWSHPKAATVYYIYNRHFPQGWESESMQIKGPFILPSESF